MTPARAEIGTVVLLLGRPVVVTGLVVDDGGRGIANDVVEVADVSPGRHQSGYAGSVSSHLVRTDPSGRFVVEAMNGSRLSVARVATEDERTWGTAVDGATVLLAPRGVFRVTVRALTLNGDPVPAEMDGCAWGIRRPGIKDVDPDLPENNLQTDELAPGVFQLTIPGSVSVVRWLSAAGFAPMRIRFAAMAWPTTTQRVEARMTPLVSTWIRIDRRGLPWPLAADGSGSGFAQVFGLPASAQPDEAIATPLSRWSVAIDDDDPVEVQLPAGSEWIVYVGDGPKVRVRAGDRNVVVQPDHSLERAQVDLNVFRQDGERVERPRLLCHDPAPPSMFDGDFPCLVVAAGLGQGRTRVSLDSGQGTIVVTDPASRQTAVIGIRRDSPQQLSVVLQPPVELVVHVRCGSRAARGVEVRVTSHGEQRSEKVDGDGRAVLHVAPGAARLQVRRGSEVLVERELTLSPGRLELELPVAL
ncbi:MAG: hypothetical protein MUC36_09450 [Planctomycetes bacterium]|nr:hypothetical protein [Planctomycetota bacterium]